MMKGKLRRTTKGTKERIRTMQEIGGSKNVRKSWEQARESYNGNNTIGTRRVHVGNAQQNGRTVQHQP